MSTQAIPSKSSSDTAPTISDAELEKLLSREASAFQRELEVERILKAFKLEYAPCLLLYCTGVASHNAFLCSAQPI
jgi:hypothetical protein